MDCRAWGNFNMLPEDTYVHKLCQHFKLHQIIQDSWTVVIVW
jgi:hypothetical protein